MQSETPRCLSTLRTPTASNVKDRAHANDATGRLGHGHPAASTEGLTYELRAMDIET